MSKYAASGLLSKLATTNGPSIYAEMHDDYAWVEVKDDGGPWNQHAHSDGHPHGLGIVNELAADWGIDGDPLTGWVVWAILDVPTASDPAP